MAMELFQHPLSIDTPVLCRMVQDVDLPEREQELALDRIAPLRHATILPCARERRIESRARSGGYDNRRAMASG